MEGFNFSERIVEWKPKRPRGDDGWSQDLSIAFRNPPLHSFKPVFIYGTAGYTPPNVDWVTLTFSKKEGYQVIYDGDQPGLHQWLEGVVGNGMLWLLDELVNGRPEQNIDQTDSQYWFAHGEADDV